MSGEAESGLLPAMSDRDLVGAYSYSGLMLGYRLEPPSLYRSLARWRIAAEEELTHRGMLKEAERSLRVLLQEHHGHDEGHLSRRARKSRSGRN